MKFSLFMMPCHHPADNPALAFQRDIGLIHLADELGFDEAFIGEHHSGGWETMPAPEMALSMAAAKATVSGSALQFSAHLFIIHFTLLNAWLFSIILHGAEPSLVSVPAV